MRKRIQIHGKTLNRGRSTPAMLRQRAKMARRLRRMHRGKIAKNQALKKRLPNKNGALVRNKRRGPDDLLPLDLTGQ